MHSWHNLPPMCMQFPADVVLGYVDFLGSTGIDDRLENTDYRVEPIIFTVCVLCYMIGKMQEVL